MFDPLLLSSDELGEIYRMGCFHGDDAGIDRLTFPKRCKIQPAGACAAFIVVQIFGQRYVIRQIVPNNQPEGVSIIVNYEIEREG